MFRVETIKRPMQNWIETIYNKIVEFRRNNPAKKYG